MTLPPDTSRIVVFCRNKPEFSVGGGACRGTPPEISKKCNPRGNFLEEKVYRRGDFSRTAELRDDRLGPDRSFPPESNKMAMEMRVARWWGGGVSALTFPRNSRQSIRPKEFQVPINHHDAPINHQDAPTGHLSNRRILQE